MDEPPEGYRKPLLVYVVEWVDEREPAESAVIQLGAFTSEDAAIGLRDRLVVEGWRDLRINMVPVHSTVEDWEFDR